MSIITTHAGVTAVLEDPAFVVPPVANAPLPAADRPGVAWLRGAVARFSEGEAHRRRRALVVAELDRADPGALRAAARARATAGDPRSAPETVPVSVLAEAMGVSGDAVADVVAEVTAVAAVYLTGATDTEAGSSADRAVGALVGRFGGVADEATAARIGLLVQACAATAGLIRGALDGGTSVEWAERAASPVPGTRRIDPGSGEVVFLDFLAANAEAGGQDPVTFGRGRHRCPGRDHAMAIAAGVVAGVRP
jgi:cytochrome P450